jgi:hypothetical protein
MGLDARPAGGDDRRRGRGHGHRADGECRSCGAVPTGSSGPARPAFIDAHAPRCAASRRKKELKKAVALERDRIEDLFVEDIVMGHRHLARRYVRHPLSGALAAG